MHPRPVGIRATRSRRRSRLLVLLLLSASVIAGACGSSTTPSASPVAGTPTVWQAITDQVINGDVSKDTALEAFAYVYGVDLPGVRVPDGRRPPGDSPQSGTGVVAWVWQHWPDDNDDVRREWAPSLLNNSTWGAPWITNGQFLPPNSTATRAEPLRIDKAGFDRTSNGLTAWIHTVAEVSNEIVVVSTDGIAAAHEDAAGGETYPAFTSKRFCVKGDCICPAGTKHAGERMADASISLPFVAAFHGGPLTWGYHIASKELAELCQLELTPAPTASRTPVPSGSPTAVAPPCPAGCASSNGDPHLRTVNRAGYDFQAAGEYVLLASADRSLEIQARQEPLAGRSDVSLNTAIALRAAGHRIGVYMTGTGLALRVDGTPVVLTAQVTVGGTRIAPHKSGVEFDLPDGTQVFLLSLGRYGINAIIHPSDPLRAGGVGLTGVVLPGGLGVPALPDGTRMPQAASTHDRYHLLYDVFGPAWRVTAATSLFDYDAGKSPADYVIPGFPAEQAVRTIEDLTPTERDTGQRACAGITDQDLLLECIFDVSVTDLLALRDLYLRTDQFVVIGTQALDAPAPAPSPVAGALPAGFVSLVPALSAVAGSALGPDGTVYLSLAEGQAGEVIAVDPATSAVVRRVSTPGSGRVAVAAGSVWVGEQPGGGACAIRRLDLDTLATLAVLPVPCDFSGPTFAATRDDVWFLDRTTADADGKGGLLRRMSLATNTADRSIELPFVNGSLSASADAIFWRDSGKDTYRLRGGASVFESIGKPGEVQFAVGDGVWTQQSGAAGSVAAFTRQAGGPDRTVPIEGALVAADDAAVYTQIIDTSDATPVLWRFPADGSDPQRLASGSRVQTTRGEQLLSYFDNAPLLIDHGHAVKLWLTPSATDPAIFQLVMQATAVP